MPSVTCPECQTIVHTKGTENEIVCTECGNKVLVEFKPSPPKTPEQRKTLSLFIGFVGSVFLFTGDLAMKGLSGIGMMLIVVALVIHFRARKDEKAS